MSTALPMADWLKRIFTVDLRTLALLRILLAALVLGDLFWRSQDLAAHYSDAGVFPRSLFLQTEPALRISLHLMNGTTWFQGLLFLLQGLFALMLLVGYRSRLATAATWLLLVSLQSRGIVYLQAGDALLRMLLFWGLFLPLGAKFSVDAALNKHASEETQAALMSNRYHSWGVVGLLLQVVYVYWFTAALKTGAEWHTDATAIYYALSVDELVRPMGEWLRQFPDFLKTMTPPTLAFEWLGPFLLLAPWGLVRLFGILCFAVLHLAFHLTLDIGLFPWVSITSVLSYTPGCVWDWLAKALKPRPLKIYYDGDCGFCKKMVRLLKTILLLDDHNIHPAQETPAVFQKMEARNSWVVMDAEGQYHYRFDAMLRLLEAQPLTRPLAVLLGLSPLRWIGNVAYSLVAGNRETGGRIFSGLKYRPLSVQPTVLGSLLAGAALLYITLWNLDSLENTQGSLLDRVTRTLKPVGTVLSLNQRWDMFAPYPLRLDTWYVIPGQLRNGREIDLSNTLLHGFGALPSEFTREKPPLFAPRYKNYRWRKYFSRIDEKKNIPYRRSLAKYLCHEWNDTHPGEEALETLQIYKLTQRNVLPGMSERPIKEKRLWRHWCFGKKRK